MRIHNEDTQGYIHALAASISRDPSSLENWRCLHMEHEEESVHEDYENALKALKIEHPHMDCEVFHCADNDVFFIGHDVSDRELFQLAQELCDGTHVENMPLPQVKMYDLFRDWRGIRELLLSKTNDTLPAGANEMGYNFGEISALQDVFDEAKQYRKARMPLHVLIVEDDPLTRRIVTNNFKDKYALITAVDAQEAIANYLLYAPDIMFLDIGLPDISGLAVLQQIMKSDPEAYVVMFSSNSYLDNITQALAAGASGFIAKPFKKEKMQQYIMDSCLHHHKYAS